MDEILYLENELIPELQKKLEWLKLPPEGEYDEDQQLQEITELQLYISQMKSRLNWLRSK